MSKLDKAQKAVRRLEAEYAKATDTTTFHPHVYQGMGQGKGDNSWEDYAAALTARAEIHKELGAARELVKEIQEARSAHWDEREEARRQEPDPPPTWNPPSEPEDVYIYTEPGPGGRKRRATGRQAAYMRETHRVRREREKTKAWESGG